MRSSIKYKRWLEVFLVGRSRPDDFQNTTLFLTTTQKPAAPAPYLPSTTANGGLKLPPFLPRKLNLIHVSDPPVSFMTEEEANELKAHIFTQLDQFEGQVHGVTRRSTLADVSDVEALHSQSKGYASYARNHKSTINPSANIFAQ